MELILISTIGYLLCGLAGWALFKIVPDSVYKKLSEKIFGV